MGGVDDVEHNWKYLHPDYGEEFPDAISEPRINPVDTTDYFDADDASYLVTRRLVTGPLVYVK